MADPKATGQTKRFHTRMALMQHVLLAKEAHARTGEALDKLTRLLFEEDLAGDTTPAPSTPRPSEPMTGEAFTRLARNRYREARTDADRRAVRDLVTKAFETGTITDDERAKLDAELRR